MIGKCDGQLAGKRGWDRQIAEHIIAMIVSAGQ